MKSIVLAGEVDANMLRELCIILDTLESKNQKALRIDICSPGGDSEIGLAIANRIRMSSIKITTHNLSQAASSGFIIFCAGHYRTCVPEALFLYHEIICTPSEDKISNIRHLVNELEKDVVRLESTMERLTGLPVSFWSGLSSKSHDTLFNAYEAKDLGLVHKIMY